MWGDADRLVRVYRPELGPELVVEWYGDVRLNIIAVERFIPAVLELISALYFLRCGS